MKTATIPPVAAASGRWGLLLTILLLLAASTAYSLDDAPVPNQAPHQYSDLKQTGQAALQTEKKDLSSVEKILQDHENRSRDLIADLGLKKFNSRPSATCC